MKQKIFFEHVGGFPVYSHLLLKTVNYMKISQNILEKYLLNQCSEAERQAVEGWYAAFEGNPDGLNTLNDDVSDQVFLKISKRIEPFKPISKPSYQPWYWAAAALFALVIGVWFMGQNKTTDARLLISKSEKPSYQKIEKPLTDWVRYENLSAKILKITLPDESAVWLRPKAQLSYNQSDRKYRQVELEGEAFFDVHRDESRPFLIYSGKMTTRVLGTSFNVRAYPNSQRFDVAVVTGQVSVSNEDGKEVVLAPKQQAMLSLVSDELLVNDLPTEQTFYWENSSLAFNDTPMSLIVKELESHFQVKISLPMALTNCRLNGHFEEERLATILEVICKSMDISYEIDGKDIRFKGEGCGGN